MEWPREVECCAHQKPVFVEHKATPAHIGLDDPRRRMRERLPTHTHTYTHTKHNPISTRGGAREDGD